MIIIVGSLSFDQADRDDVIASLKEITDLSRRDIGCIEYSWSEDLLERNKFRFFECWDTQEHFDSHLAAPHERDFGERNLSRITDATATTYTAIDITHTGG